MANLQETSTWEAGIYQLETSDPVMGGENGIDNRAPRQLANRTLWLKNELARQIGVVNSGKLGKTENAVSATKLATARNIAMTGDGLWNVNFDGSQNATGALTLANSGVTAGSYNSVTVDAKGRVTAGLTQTHGLVTATTATGTANVATGNGNTFLNIVASGVGQTASVGSSTQITGTNGIAVSSDTAGKLILRQTLANSLTDTSTAKALTALQGKVLDEKIVALGNEKAQLQNNKLDKTGGTVTGEIISTNANAYRLKSTTANRSVILRSDGSHFYLLKTADGDPDGNWDSARPFVWDLRSNTVTLNGNSATATKLATARTLAITGDGTGQANFDGSANANIAITLANSGVTAGSYNSVTVDAKGRVTAGLTQTHGLVTATTATGTTNTATTNTNTFLNIVASGVGQTASVGSSTQITGTNGISVSSDIAGKLIVTRDSNSPTATKLQTARNITLTGAVTGNVNFDGSGNVSLATTLNLTDFANNKNENGYQKLPNGLILQWGNKPDHSAVVFPVAFPNSVLNVSLTLKVNSRDSDNQEAFGVHSVTNTGFSIFNWVPSQGCYWFAIGY